MPSKNISSVCYPCGITANYLSCLKKYGKPPLQAAFTFIDTLLNPLTNNKE